MSVPSTQSVTVKLSRQQLDTILGALSWVTEDLADDLRCQEEIESCQRVLLAAVRGESAVLRGTVVAR